METSKPALWIGKVQEQIKDDFLRTKSLKVYWYEPLGDREGLQAEYGPFDQGGKCRKQENSWEMSILADSVNVPFSISNGDVNLR